jgi:hypothetical protein
VPKRSSGRHLHICPANATYMSSLEHICPEQKRFSPIQLKPSINEHEFRPSHTEYLQCCIEDILSIHLTLDEITMIREKDDSTTRLTSSSAFAAGHALRSNWQLRVECSMRYRFSQLHEAKYSPTSSGGEHCISDDRLSILNIVLLSCFSGMPHLTLSSVLPSDPVTS